MKNTLIMQLVLFSTFFIQNTSASGIIQCTQPDGTIEFTNQGCSKSNSISSRSSYKKGAKSLRTKKKRNSAPFRQASFVKLQKKLIKAETQDDAEKHARIITKKVRSYAMKGKLKYAYDMIAATYASLSKDIKKKQWDGMEISTQTLKIRTLFEKILITQSSTSNAKELNLAIEDAWTKHLANY